MPGARALAALPAQPQRAVRGAAGLVEVLESPSLFFRGMAGSRMPIAVSHGEGRASSTARATPGRRTCALRYVDRDGACAARYPANPNGSPRGIAGLTSADGRSTLLMPHPERVHSHRADELAPGRVGRGLAVAADVPERARSGWREARHRALAVRRVGRCRPRANVGSAEVHGLAGRGGRRERSRQRHRRDSSSTSASSPRCSARPPEGGRPGARPAPAGRSRRLACSPCWRAWAWCPSAIMAETAAEVLGLPLVSAKDARSCRPKAWRCRRAS